MSEWDENKKAWVPERQTYPFGDNVRDVFDGPIATALASVFRQLEDMGVKRNGR